MMTRYFLLALAITAVVNTASGQTDPLYAQYLSNPLVLNPAYAGFSKDLTATASFRRQWTGFDGSPSTVNAAAHASLADNRMGIGLMLVGDKIGINRNTEVQAMYAYRIDLGNKVLSFGLQAGFISFRADNTDLNVYDPNGGEFSSNLNYSRPSFGAGVILSNDRFFAGLSVPRMLKASAKLDNRDVEVYRQHFYFAGTYLIDLSHRVRLRPSVLLKHAASTPLSVDVNTMFTVDERYGAGLFTRNLDTFGIIARAVISDKYRIGYAFEVPAGSVGTGFPSHEITLGISMSVFGFHDLAAVSSF